MNRVFHRPRGNPCECGVSLDRHYPSHYPDSGDSCSCGAPAENHKSKHDTTYCVGLDGEGMGRAPHRYTLLCYSDAHGRTAAHIENSLSLTTEQCLDFILSIPKRARIFSFAFSYDLTKILQELPERTLWYLCRPDKRRRPPESKGRDPYPVRWGKYLLNLVGRKFVVTCGKIRRVVWDIFAFYQKKFVSALADWKILPQSDIDHMSRMKDKRGELDKETPQDVRDYCYSECESLARLAQRLIDAHEAVGLKLRAYHGAGSTASALMMKYGIAKCNRETPRHMLMAVASSFFGGRFENAWSGICEGPVWGHDISSAYPYMLYQLPCLDCGRWEFTKDEQRILSAKDAFINYSLPDIGKDEPWGPLPFRTKKGSIVFPRAIGEGWCCLREYVATTKMFHVQLKGAWVYHCDCDHRPFSFIPGIYRERLRIGKEGPGIVLKLGPNSCYGKIAQSIGDKPPFQCWIWASLITGGCRAQALDVMALHKNRGNLLMIATDGIFTKENVSMPKPVDTGTWEAVTKEGKVERKPLGGWESKDVPQGIFLARPGIYFPLEPTEKDIEKVRARGVGRANLYRHWQTVLDAHKEGKDKVTIANVSRFYGMKSCVRRLERKGAKFPEYIRSDQFGEWGDIPVQVSFSPMPKRERIESDGFMPLRSMEGLQSAPYNRAILSDEALAEILAKQMLDEQPDADLMDIE